MKESQNSIDRTFELLTYLSLPGRCLNVTEISNLLSISRATAHSLVKTLLRWRCIEKGPHTEKYVIGHKLFELGELYRYHFPFVSVSEKYIADMVTKHHIKVNVSILKPPSDLIILVTRHDLLVPEMKMGYIMPAYATASGKILLSAYDDETLEEWFSQINFQKITQQTITDPKKLLAEIKTTRQKGFAIDNCELVEQRICISTPIKDYTRKVIASLSFSGDATRVSQEINTLLADLMVCSRSISSDLGYHGQIYQSERQGMLSHI